MYNCALCAIHACNTRNLKKAPKNCPSLDTGMTDIISLYSEKENYKIARSSSIIVEESYGTANRLEETIAFAKKCNYKKIGLAFCIGLKKESRIVSKILSEHGFEVSSIICKNGGVSRDLLDIHTTEVPMCNPIAQAILLNKNNTDFNILLGLCVGHDSLFIKYSQAPVTIFAVKDRVLCHNPLGAISDV